MNDCPICGGSSCQTYPLMLERFAAGRDREHWRAVHDRMNGITPSYPPLLEQLGNAARAAVGFVASGVSVADEAEQGRRIAICHTCEFFDHAQERCFKCGCAGGWKAWVASSKCPTGK